MYRIALCAEKVGPKGFIIGVRNDFQRLGKPIDDGQIELALTGKIKSGKRSDWWPFYTSVDQYWDWSALKVLHKLHHEGKSVASELAEQMRRIALATEKVIDNICSEFPDSTLD